MPMVSPSVSPSQALQVLFLIFLDCSSIIKTALAMLATLPSPRLHRSAFDDSSETYCHAGGGYWLSPQRVPSSLSQMLPSVRWLFSVRLSSSRAPRVLINGSKETRDGLKALPHKNPNSCATSSCLMCTNPPTLHDKA